MAIRLCACTVANKLSGPACVAVNNPATLPATVALIAAVTGYMPAGVRARSKRGASSQQAAVSGFFVVHLARVTVTCSMVALAGVRKHAGSLFRSLNPARAATTV